MKPALRQSSDCKTAIVEGLAQRIVSGDYSPASVLETAPINVRGLDVLEELLFATATGNHCDSFDPINASGTWAAVSDLAARRASYAASVAAIAHAEIGRAHV